MDAGSASEIVRQELEVAARSMPEHDLQSYCGSPEAAMRIRNFLVGYLAGTRDVIINRLHEFEKANQSKEGGEK